jgi:glycolate oxidase
MVEHPAIPELTQIVGQKNILTDRNELRVYECDGFPIAKGMPMAVVLPENTQQVSQCVKTLASHDLAIVPRGSGTGLAGGSVVYDKGVIICTSRMNQIHKVDLENRVAIVQSGCRNSALSEAIACTGLRFSPDPSSQRAATIGGNVSTNAGGINTLKHGVTTNHILGLEVVLPDGEILLTRANQCYDGIGPDLPGLLCGSEGILGIITRVWCRLVPDPKAFRTIYAVFHNNHDACKTVADVIASGILPTSMEMMDGAMIQVVENAFHFGFDTSAGALLLIEVDGVDEILDDEMKVIIDIAQANHAMDIQFCKDAARRAELWSARKKTFGAIGRISRSYCTMDACVPRSLLPEVVARVTEIGKAHDLQINNVFHAGDGNIHPILLFDEDKPQQVQRVMEASEEILAYCVSVGGTITGEHGVGVEKLAMMHAMFDKPTLKTFLDLKKTFDPDQRFNDAKLIPSDKLKIELHQPMVANVPGGAL